MFSILTERLRLLPLSLAHLELLQNSRSELEKALNLVNSNMQIEESILETLDKTIEFWIEKVAADPINYPWHSSWEIIHQKENRSIGMMGLSGIPNENGETVIGYSIDLRYHNQGFMTEALTGLINWAAQHPRLKRMIAETSQDNYSSHRVLIKNGFERIYEYLEDETLLFGKVFDYPT